MSKSSKELLLKLQKEKYDSGVAEIVGADKITKDGFLMISKYVARQRHLTPATKLVWGCIVNHAWNDKDSCFPGQYTIAGELGMSVKTVSRALLQLQGLNDLNEVYLKVIHRGHGLTNIYRIFFKMKPEDAKRVMNKATARKDKMSFQEKTTLTSGVNEPVIHKK